MTEKNLFNLAVRILGLVFLYLALTAIPVAISLLVTATSSDPALTTQTSGSMNTSRVIGALVMVLWPLVLAIWLIRGAPLLMRLAYGDRGA